LQQKKVNFIRKYFKRVQFLGIILLLIIFYHTSCNNANSIFFLL